MIDAAFWLTSGAILLLLVLSAFFSGSETALTASSRGKLKSQAEKGQKGAERALELTEDSERLIGSILLGNNLVNILATSLATAMFTRAFGESGVALATLVMTLLVLIFAEVLPKTYAISNSESAAARVAGPIGVVVLLLGSGCASRPRDRAQALRDAGYTTAIAGKWHLGEWLDEHLPMGQGFDHQYGHYGWGIDYTNFTIPHNSPATFAVYDWHRDQRPMLRARLLHRPDCQRGRTDDRGTTRGAEESDWHSSAVFLLRPLQRDPRPAGVDPALHGQARQTHGRAQVPRRRGRAHRRRGRPAWLRRQHPHRLCQRQRRAPPDQNAPYRGTKNTTYEGGVRVPCVVRWPGKIEPGSANDEMMFIADFYNTFITLGGADPKQERAVDGLDMTATLFAGNPSPRDEIIFDVAGCVRLPTIRKGDWKLMGEELYNIAQDPSEATDLAKQELAVVAALKQRLAEAAKERPPMPRMDRLMSPAQPWVYGQRSNADVPGWVKEAVQAVRDTQPNSWAEGKTPWPQAPKDGKIIYSGDGR